MLQISQSSGYCRWKGDAKKKKKRIEWKLFKKLLDPYISFPVLSYTVFPTEDPKEVKKTACG